MHSRNLRLELGMGQRTKLAWFLLLGPESYHTVEALTMAITVTDDVETRLGW